MSLILKKHKILNAKGVLKVFFLVTLCWLQIVFAKSENNPHKTSPASDSNKKECLNCHKTLPKTPFKSDGQHIIPNMKLFIKSETDMCIDCHGKDSKSHIVGVTPEYSVPADLPLDLKNSVTCLTCHYIHGSLKSDTAMASSSVMDQLFNRERLKKSFMLRRNNSKGDLCLACHKRK